MCISTNNARRAKTSKINKQSRKEKIRALFTIVPLNLTLNNASASLISVYCLGTLIYHMTLEQNVGFM
jgi:Na+-transporting methylmalonyl-CoA/oxaloacetate decarboxylase beta subunit